MKNSSRGAPPVNDYGNMPRAPGKGTATRVDRGATQPAVDKRGSVNVSGHDRPKGYSAPTGTDPSDRT